MTEFTKKHVAMLALLGALAIVVTSLVFIGTQVEQAYTMDMTVKVQQGVTGFDLNTSVVTFGKLKPGQQMDRYFEVNNTGTRPVTVYVRTSGQLASWVRVNPRVFDVTPEQKTGKFTASIVIPSNADVGNYTGKLLVLVMRQ
mgnify:CR=1 FL=1